MSKTFLLVVFIVTGVIIGALWFFSQGSVSPGISSETASSLELQTDDIAQNATTTMTLATSTEENTQTATTTIDTNKKYMNATLHTNKGDITIQFNTKDTPNTVANFIKLAGSGFYDGVKFHRVIKGFMIQGGDPLTKDDSKMALWGTGGPGYSFDDELTPDNKNNTGTIAMANSGPNTNGSQFFINVVNNNFLDTKHVVFGHVTSGMDVVTAIENTPTTAGGRPITPVVIKSVTLK